MASDTTYDYMPDEQGNGYEINPGEAAEVRRLFEEAAMNKVAICLRVATPEQATSKPKRAAIYAYAAVAQDLNCPNYGIAVQIEACKAHCTAHGYTVGEEHILQETGTATLRLDRPQLTAIREAACNREIDVLVIHHYTCISRSQVQQAAFIEELKQYGVTVESTDEHDQEDLTKLIEAIRKGVAQMERQQIIKRHRYGATAKKAQREQQQ
jgi:DNA invertase Pin-like site-specific DNA recombinase